MFTSTDYALMAEALRLAEKGLYTATPNPRVGCVVARESHIVGQGFHERAGGPHAEVLALNAAGSLAQDATAYVSLEPCSHHGRTPPCAEALVRAKVARVVAAMEDPNPLVAGKGLALLREAGIQVECGLLEREAHALNIGFVSRMTRNRPWVRLKLAASLDGKIALNNGGSQWITGEAARRDGHHWRARSCAVLTGIGTILDDDPRLTVRHVQTSRQPLRVVLDSRAQMPLGAKVLAEAPALVFVAANESAKIDALKARGAEVVVLPDASGKVDLAGMMQELARRQVNEVLVEAGFKLNGSLLKAGVVDELLVYLAPHLLGDAARGMFNLPELTDLSGRRKLEIRDARMIGADLRLLASLI